MNTQIYIRKKNKKSFDFNKLYLFLIFIFFCNSIIAQTNFRPGYYITWENDTIHGLIDLRGEIRNSRFCIYKQNKNAESVNFTPSQIKAYRFLDDKYYVSKEIELDKTQTPMFLEILVDGVTNLYYMRDTDKDMYFIEKADGSLYKLIRKYSTSYNPSKGTIIRESFNYIGLLKIAFSDCWEIQPKLNNAKLSHQSLIDLSEKYHNYVCDYEQCVIYEKELPPFKFQVAPIIGLDISSLTFNKGFYSKFDFTPSASPIFGILLNTILPRSNDKISFQAEVLFQSENLNGIYNSLYQNTFEMYVESKKIQTSLGIVYNFPRSKVRPTISVGGFGTYLLDINKKSVVTIGSYETIKEDEVYLPLINSFYGLYMQLGCNFHIFNNRETFTNLKIMHGGGYYASEKEKKPIKNSFNSIYFNIGFYLVKNE